MLYNAAIASRTNYCDVVWDNCSQRSQKKLQTIQNRCVRSITGNPPGTSALPLIRDLGWLTLKEKRKLHKCVMLHQLMQGKGPEALLNALKPWINTCVKTTRGTTSECLQLLTHRTNYIDKSYFYDTVKVWNRIPLKIRKIENRATFKENLHKHILNSSM